MPSGLLCSAEGRNLPTEWSVEIHIVFNDTVNAVQ
eukprot:COSAG02_NODE_521_length_20750_cov_10.721079_24_plen_35_part_00